MLQNDYILRIIMDLVLMIRRSWALPELDKKTFSDDIEEAVGEAVGIDPTLFFSLEPDSAVSMMEMGDIDDDVAAYVTQALFLESKVLEDQGDIAAATLRRRQATAIARRYGTAIPDEAESAEGLVRFFMEDDPMAPGPHNDGQPEARREPLLSDIPADKLKIDDL